MLIRTHELAKTYVMGTVEVRALRGVDLSVGQGEFMSIIGRSGAYDLAHGGDDLRLLSVAAVATSGQPMLVHLEAQIEQLLEA